MDYAISKLKQDEVVLMKKIKGLQDGKPKWNASKQLDEIRSAIKLLERYNDITAEDAECYTIKHGIPAISRIHASAYDSFVQTLMDEV